MVDTPPAGPPPADAPPADPPPPAHGPETTVFNPIVLIAFTIIAGIFVLILFAMLGRDGGFVERLGTPNFARGLITYLFAITTIFAAVGLLVASLTTLIGHDSAEAKEKFQRGKDVLGLLLGVFGTIVGFYFGTATQNAAATGFVVSAPEVSPTQISAAQTTTLTSAVSGGLPPYRFAVGTAADGSIGDFRPVQPNGVIVTTIRGDEFPADGKYDVHLRVVDSIGTVRNANVEVQRRAAPATAPAAQ